MPRELGAPPRCPDATRGEPLEIRYLGVAGALLRRGSTAILAAPFFSNPRLLRVMFGRIDPDAERIDAALAPLASELADVRAVLVGHAHYDHLMDVPHVATRYTPEARILGSHTAVNILRGFDLQPHRLEALNPIAASHWRPGSWVPLDGARVMAIRSEHAPHFLGRKAFGGAVDEALDRPPRRARGYPEGQPFTFLIDFLDPDGSVAARVFYQDTASNAPVGFPPTLPAEDAHPVDVAILCVASLSQVRGYPEGIVRATNPRLVVMAHWEDFFVPPDVQRPVPATDVGAFVERLRRVLPADARAVLPNRFEAFTVPICR